MGALDKLEKKISSNPRGFTWNEAIKLLRGHGFELSNKGKTSGSRVKFYRSLDQRIIMLHKPHPQKELKEYQCKEIIKMLEL